MKKIVFFILLLLPVCLFSQTDTITRSVYFDNDKFNLKPNDENLLGKLLDSLIHVNIISIDLKGNTDAVADNNYNLKLSAKRTDAVRDFLISKKIDSDIITIEAQGEEKPIANNTSEEGKQKNRRVDIRIKFEKIEVVDSIVHTDPCKRDTVIIFPQGTQLVFNLCEYNEIKECLEVTETNDPSSILVNGQSTMDPEGIPLASCGMLRIGLKPGCTDRPCFKVPVKVRFPVPKSKDCAFCGRSTPVWNRNLNGTWSADGKNKLKIVKVKGVEFYQMTLDCPNSWKNCDCRLKYKKIKFKAKQGFMFTNLKVGSDCPVGLWAGKTKNKGNVSIVKVPCFKGDKFVYATLVNKDGDTLELTYRSLNDLPKRYLFAKCGKDPEDIVETKIWGIFPYKKRMWYRKYLVPVNLLTSRKK